MGRSFSYKIFTPPYDTLIPHLFDGKHSLKKINKLLPEVPIDMIIPEIREEYVNNDSHILKELLKKNDLSNWKPNAPIQMCYCKGDKEVPFQNTLVTKKNMDMLGTENIKTKCASKSTDIINVQVFQQFMQSGILIVL